MKRRGREATGRQTEGIPADDAMGQAASRAGTPPRCAGGLLRFLQTSKVKKMFLNVLILYVSVPFLVRMFPPLLQKFVYLNFLAYPFGVDYQKPEVYLNHTQNFYLTSEPGITFGFWHSLPDSRRKEAEGKDRSWYEEALADDNPIIIYLHGNGGTRATSHRVLFAKVMSDGGFHVLAVDYRGYADSTGHPSEDGFTKDILCIYDWVKARSGNSTVILWGHSLGSGFFFMVSVNSHMCSTPIHVDSQGTPKKNSYSIATNTARHLQEKDGVIVDAIILEAPYTNIREAAANIPFTKIYRKFPGFESLILDTMARAGMYFLNDKNVQVLSSPLLILHSEDDSILPIHLGRKLYEMAHNASAKKEHVQFIAFPASMGFGHDFIAANPELPAIVKEFLNSIK